MNWFRAAELRLIFPLLSRAATVDFCGIRETEVLFAFDEVLFTFGEVLWEDEELLEDEREEECGEEE